MDPKPPPQAPSEATVLAAATGRRYGDVVIQRALGNRSIEEAFLGFDEKLGFPVVLMLLAERFLDTPLGERYLRDVQATVRLDHPHISRVFGVGRERDRVYRVVEHVEGQDLQEYSKGGRLPVEEALRLIGEASRGLACAHAEGIAHGDIRPERLARRSRDGQVKVLDFGLARAIDMDEVASASIIKSALPYMAPERLVGGGTLASDVYSLGVSLYFLLSGRLPAMGELACVLSHHNDGKVVKVSDVHAVPSEVDGLVSRMLARRGEDRPDAGTVARSIDAILSSQAPPPGQPVLGKLARAIMDAGDGQ